jgi:CBS domain-containing protein
MLRNPKLLGPGTTVEQVCAFLTDEHVHAALLADGPRLLGVIEPCDLAVSTASGDAPALTFAHLRGRVTPPEADLASAWKTMAAQSRRRLAVVDTHGDLLGLLCLKRGGLGFCSDDDVRNRAREHGR